VLLLYLSGLWFCSSVPGFMLHRGARGAAAVLACGTEGGDCAVSGNHYLAGRPLWHAEPASPPNTPGQARGAGLHLVSIMRNSTAVPSPHCPTCPLRLDAGFAFPTSLRAPRPGFFYFFSLLYLSSAPACGTMHFIFVLKDGEQFRRPFLKFILHVHIPFSIMQALFCHHWA
jgi:hypothetical protein